MKEGGDKVEKNLMGIYFEDLKEDVQKDVLQFLHLENFKEGNLDVTPLFVLETEE